MQASSEPPLLWRAIGSRDRCALADLNNDCFPLRYEDDFYDSVCGNRPGVISMAAFEGGDMVAAIVLRCAPASNFEDDVVSTWRSWSSWDDPVNTRAYAVVGQIRRVTALADRSVHLHYRSCSALQAQGPGCQGTTSRVVQFCVRCMLAKPC